MKAPIQIALDGSLKAEKEDSLEQWINEGKQAVKLTRLSCQDRKSVV